VPLARRPIGTMQEPSITSTSRLVSWRSGTKAAATIGPSTMQPTVVMPHALQSGLGPL
jgi:hypothetical protein